MTDQEHAKWFQSLSRAAQRKVSENRDLKWELQAIRATTTVNDKGIYSTR